MRLYGRMGSYELYKTEAAGMIPSTFRGIERVFIFRKKLGLKNEGSLGQFPFADVIWFPRSIGISKRAGSLPYALRPSSRCPVNRSKMSGRKS